MSPLSERVLARLADACAELTVEPAALAEAGRDRWPLGLSLGRPDVVARPRSAEEVVALLSIWSAEGIPVTPAGGRSGVCGGAVPLSGGMALELGGLAGIRSVEPESMVVDVLAGTRGDVLDTELRTAHGLTLGHRPQSLTLSTVGGWLACRSAGQLSTRYGKIEDLCVGLDVVLADGRALSTGGAPRAATGPDLTQLFLGSEGTLGVITTARLRARPVPAAAGRAAYGFDRFSAGIAACRRILQRGGTPAVLRLYDDAESAAAFGTEGSCVLVVADEGDEVLVDATMRIVDEECGAGTALGTGPVDHWFAERDDVSGLERMAAAGMVGDTMEVAASWPALAEVHGRVTSALVALEGMKGVWAHQSHAYSDGACLYFTFGGMPPSDPESFYVAAWDTAVAAALSAGANLSHHHGIGINKARFLPSALGPAAFDVLAALKGALDPGGILNPGKLGLPSPFSGPRWP